jgi:hypothetical protein
MLHHMATILVRYGFKMAAKIQKSSNLIFCTLVTMATSASLNFSTPQKLPHTTVDIPTKFHEV